MRSDAEIVRAVLGGDREAFAVLVSRHEKSAWATSWRILRDGHAASDVTQDAFLQAYQRLRHLRDPARFGGWLLRIAHREAVRASQRRRQSPVRPGEDEDGLAEFTSRATPLGDEDSLLLDAVAALPEPERLVVVLYYLESHPVAEIARMLSRPVGTVTKQLSRAIHRLRSRLDVRSFEMRRGLS